jgi:hypothetical protein
MKKLMLLFVLILFHAVACAQADYRARYFLTVGGNFTRYDLGEIKLRPMLLPAIGIDLTHHYSDKIAINAGTRYSFRGSANDTLLVHNHYHDFFIAPRYIITPDISAELGLQFNNLMHGASWLHHKNEKIKGGSLYGSQLEVYAGITYNISRDVNVNLRYTLPGPWMDHSSLMASISHRILPRYKAAGTSFGSLDEALENQLACQKLILHRKGIEVLSDDIGTLVNMEELFLDGNKLEVLPASIGQLENLKFLFLRNNKLQELPPEISLLSHLEELDLRHNRLTGLPDEIGNLESLKFLYLQNNFISEIPSAIGKLQSLTELDVSNNMALMTLPPEINQLRNLEKLIISGHTLLPVPFSPASSKLQVIVR